jgi:hypothetical protein
LLAANREVPLARPDLDPLDHGGLSRRQVEQAVAARAVCVGREASAAAVVLARHFGMPVALANEAAVFAELDVTRSWSSR